MRVPQYSHKFTAWKGKTALSYPTNKTVRSWLNGATRWRVSPGTELAIPRISQPRHDVADLIEVAVHRPQVDGHIGMGLAQQFNAFRRADDTDVFDALHSPILEQAHCGGGRSPGGQHRVQHQADAHGGQGGQLVVILDRLQGLLVPIQADVPYLGIRQQLPNAVDHAQPRPQ